ncbi:MAG: metallophosphoesterase family protein [Chloroflexi bacterium]|nr:metallophosphoesterase family protein [Chloroflexota bacterium]
MGSLGKRFDLSKLAVASVLAYWVVLSFVGTASVLPVAAQGIELTKGPYLQNATQASVNVCWETNEIHSGAVMYGKTLEYGSIALTKGRAKDHCVSLTGLEPYTRYYYQVWGSEKELFSGGTFKTLAGPEGRISFVAWGDNRTNHPIHRRLVGLIKEAAPDFVINVGDLVENGSRKSDWDTFFDVERELLVDVPLYPTLGNHEQNSYLYFALFDLPGTERWYSFDSGPAHFIALDVAFSDYKPGSEQYDWLEQDLRQTTRPWKIVYLHYPPYSFTPFRGSELPVREALTPLFEKYGVQLAFSGHNHHYQRNLVNGVTYIVTGGGGAPLHPVGWGVGTQYAEETYEFVKLSIDGGVLTSTVVSLDGTQFDPFVLSLPTKVEEQKALVLGMSAPVIPQAAVVPEELAGVSRAPNSAVSISLIESVSCIRCHDPFRLDNRTLLLYGWDFHRPLIVAGGFALILAALMMVLSGRHLFPNLRTRRRPVNDASGAAHS